VDDLLFIIKVMVAVTFTDLFRDIARTLLGALFPKEFEPVEDNEPRHHISCVNCAIEWASQYESDNEITKRKINEYIEGRAYPMPRDAIVQFNVLKDWLDNHDSEFLREDK